MSGRQRVNIFDIAREASVGVATVSRVLNNSPKVSTQTRARVQSVIDRLGYRPSSLASGLSRGRPTTISVLIPHLTRPSAIVRLSGILEILDAAGHSTVVCSVGSAAQRDRHLDALMDRHAAIGVLVMSIPLTAARIASFRSAGVPLVLVDTQAPDTPYVMCDDVYGGRLATEHLISLGHERIAFVGDEVESGMGFSSTQRRLFGMRQALEAHRLAYDHELVSLGAHSATEARRQAEELLRGDSPPTAIFAASDTQATGVLAAAEALNLRVPSDLAVIGFDGLEVASMVGLSTIRQPLYETGVIGARLMCDLLEGRTPLKCEVLLDLQLEARESTTGIHGDGVGRSPPVSLRGPGWGW